MSWIAFVGGAIGLALLVWLLVTYNRLIQGLRLQAEPSAIMLGANYNGTFELRGFEFESVSKTELFYLQLPLLLQLTSVPREETVFGRPRARTTYHFSGGVFGGYLLDARFSGTNTGAPIGIAFEGSFSNDVTSQFSDYDAGMILGGGLEHGAHSKIGLEGRVHFSVLDSNKSNQFNLVPNSLAVTMAVYYLF
jgi:hypothetical protein